MNFNQKIAKTVIVWLFASFLTFPAHAALRDYFRRETPLPAQMTSKLYDMHPWSLMAYYGQVLNQSMISVFTGKWNHWPESVYSTELLYTLNEDNMVRRFFNPVVGVVQVGGNVAFRNGEDQPGIFEFEPYIMFRWANWPWNDTIVTSFALAEGVSYTTSVPYIEKRQHTNTKRILNYLALEATFADPSCPNLQVLLRIHHRSGAFGLYGAGNTGSNAIGGGIRYLF